MHINVKLLQDCAKGNQLAQQKLYKACYQYLMPLCMQFHNNQNDARAIYNIAFIKIIDNLHTLALEKGSFIAWSRRIMHNTLIDDYRKNKKYREKISKRDDERELEYFSNGIENQAETDYNENSVLHLLNYLKPTTKQVFVLYVIEGYSHKEIGELMEMSDGTSKWHLSVARKELRKLIEKQNKLTDREIAI